MIQLRRINAITRDLLEQIVPGYSSDAVYKAAKSESGHQLIFTLTLEKLGQPFVKKHQYLDPSILAHYNDVATQGLSYGAFSGDQCIGFVLAEVQHWNLALVVREFGVLPEMREQGIGKMLMAKLIEDARSSSLRCVFCETQTSNLAAIEFYKKQGFVVEGFDMSFYSNQDAQQCEVALFLRKFL